jgi:hypothetical protein
MHKHLFLAVFTFITLAFLPAAAEPSTSKPNCTDKLTKAIQALDRVESYVPQVPPEEKKYLEKEYSAASNAGPPERFGKLTQRPMYYAWQMHDAFANARFTLEENQKINPIVGVRGRIFAAHDLPMALANARSAWEDVITHSTLDNPIVTFDQVREGTEGMTYLSGMPGLYYDCLADWINEK